MYTVYISTNRCVQYLNAPVFATAGLFKSSGRLRRAWGVDKATRTLYRPRMAARTATANINGDLPDKVREQFARIQEVLNGSPRERNEEAIEVEAQRISEAVECPQPSTPVSPVEDGSEQ